MTFRLELELDELKVLLLLMELGMWAWNGPVQTFQRLDGLPRSAFEGLAGKLSQMTKEHPPDERHTACC